MYRFTRESRLLKAKAFQQVFKKGIKKYHKGISVIAARNDQNSARLGFAISKKQVKRACDRNTLKRIAREVFRHQQNELTGIDFVVLVNKTCLEHKKLDLHHYFQTVFISVVKCLSE